MKMKCNFLIAALYLMTVTVAGAQEQPYPDRIFLVLLIDTSWECGDDMPEIRTLGRQGVGSLRFGDSVEILSAHPGRPRIRLAQTIYYGTFSQNTITRTLADIRDGFLTNAQVNKALKMALDRLNNTFAKQHYAKAVVIILSDGHLNNGDAGRVLKLAEQFKKRGWPLYITGDKNTNKNLLIASSKNQINWSLISDANPAIWLEQARESSLSEKEKETVQQAPPENEATEKDEPNSVSAVVTDSQVADVKEPKNTETDKKETEEADDNSRSSSKDIKARFKTELDVIVSGDRPHQEPIDVNSLASEDFTKSSVEEDATPILSTEPNIPKEPLAQEKTPEIQKPRKPSIWPRAKQILGNIWLWIGVACLIVYAMLRYLFSGGNKKAKELITRRTTLSKDKQKNDGMVVATVNGRTHHLGTKSRLTVINIGSGVNNTIRIPEKGVSNRHLRIYRQNSKLMIQNTGAAPVTMSGRQLKPKEKQPLTLPVTIEFTKNAQLKLSLLNPKDKATSERSKVHEKAK